MDKIKKNFGFGCMRLPMVGEEIDYEEFNKMIDTFLEAGFNYFDTAHGYINGKSETAIRDCLAARHSRESYILTNKLSPGYFNTREEIRPLFQHQLEQCGVEYFDFYLMHALSNDRFDFYQQVGAFDEALLLKAEGKIRHMGISFHDKAAVLDRILTERPDIEVVQIQFNYMDYEDPIVESRACYEVCRKHNKPVIVMEPVKGGKLAQMSDDALAVYKELGEMSPASYAIRFVAGHEGVMMTLSGMGNMDMMNDNLSYMKDFQPLNQKETEAVWKVADILIKQNQIACTGCRYCVDGCPAGILIPDLFTCVNAKRALRDPNADAAYQAVPGGRSADCVDCGQCEEACPQHLPVRQLLKMASRIF
jgi:predicted aldo/keto reductase-like oxidoreductase